MSRPSMLPSFFQTILTMVGSSNVLNDPVERLQQETGKVYQTVIKALFRLEEMDLIQKTVDDGRGRKILRIEVLSREFPKSPADQNSPKSTPKKTRADPKTTPDPPPTPATLPVSRETQPLVVVLVDYDNVVGAALQSGTEISFSLLRNFVRRNGRPLFAEVFLSPHSTNARVVQVLSHAGFEVIACPQERKDKDAVDTKLKSRARRYLQYTPVTAVVIVSEDRDFSDDPDLTEFARDLGKEIVVERVSRHLAQLAGGDEAPELLSSRKVQNFKDVLRFARDDISPVGAHKSQLNEFMCDVIRGIGQITENTDRRFAFKHLMEEVWDNVSGRWGGVFEQRDLKAAMTALVETDTLYTQKTSRMIYYKLNPHDKLIKRLLGGKVTP